MLFDRFEIRNGVRCCRDFAALSGVCFGQRQHDADRRAGAVRRATAGRQRSHHYHVLRRRPRHPAADHARRQVRTRQLSGDADTAGVTAGLRKVMATYRPVYDSRHLQADCQEPGSAPEPYSR